MSGRLDVLPGLLIMCVTHKEGSAAPQHKAELLAFFALKTLSYSTQPQLGLFATALESAKSMILILEPSQEISWQKSPYKQPMRWSNR